MKTFKLAIPSVIKDDMNRKLVSVFFASLIWYFVHQHISEVEIFKNVKVDVVTTNTNQVIVSSYKPEISLEVRGPRQILNNLESKDIQVSIRLEGLSKPGISELKIRNDHITLPEGLKVESILTKTINVNVDVIEEKEVDVKLRYTNRLSEKYALDGQPTVKPDRVTIKGPSKRLNKISYVDTRPVYIDSTRTTEFSVTTKVVTPEDITMNYDNVTAYIDIKKRLDTRSLPVQNVYILEVNSSSEKNYKKIAGQAFANISGPPSVINSIKPETDVRLFIEAGDNISEECEIRFWCKDPSVTAVTITPSTILLNEELLED